MKDGAIPNSLTLITFDHRCLDLSWGWLNDPEIKTLTMSPTFTRDDQRKFFENLPSRKDYIAWGIELDGNEIVGVAGLKNYRNSLAEYWGYIGERQHWGKGLGKCLIAAVETKARDLGFSALDLRVSSLNSRAIALYKKTGFVVDMAGSTNGYLHMVKRGI